VGEERFAAVGTDVLGYGRVVLFSAGGAGEVREVHQKIGKAGAVRAAMVVLEFLKHQEETLRVSGASTIGRFFYLARRGATGPGDSFR
jgi:hypothetical protein